MFNRILTTLFVMLAATAIHADMLPGFRAELITPAEGFVSSIAFDQDGTAYYTTTDGEIWRHGENQNELVATVPTANEGNAALLGMAFDHEGFIIVHYVAADFRSDVISRIDPSSGEETIVADIVCSTTIPCPTEHHGGNPIVAPDGTIFVGLGDHGVWSSAQDPQRPGGKIYRISDESPYTVEAIGFRNPYDMAWDARFGRLIVGDNGPVGHDEINFVYPGLNYGWPWTFGTMPPFDGTEPPVYTFDGTVAPTGLAIVSGHPFSGSGILVGAFVTSAIYYFPYFDEHTLAEPITLIEGETTRIIDVAQHPNGEVWFATTYSIYRLVSPLCGDVNGDGTISAADYGALKDELLDGLSQPVYRSHQGEYRSSWGADVDQNGVIDSADLVELASVLSFRRRPLIRRTSGSRSHPVTRGGSH